MKVRPEASAPPRHRAPAAASTVGADLLGPLLAGTGFPPPRRQAGLITSSDAPGIGRAVVPRAPAGTFRTTSTVLS